jgi:hypothetical protein
MISTTTSVEKQIIVMNQKKKAKTPHAFCYKILPNNNPCGDLGVRRKGIEGMEGVERGGGGGKWYSEEQGDGEGDRGE